MKKILSLAIVLSLVSLLHLASPNHVSADDRDICQLRRDPFSGDTSTTFTFGYSCTELGPFDIVVSSTTTSKTYTTSSAAGGGITVTGLPPATYGYSMFRSGTTQRVSYDESFVVSTRSGGGGGGGGLGPLPVVNPGQLFNPVISPYIGILTNSWGAGGILQLFLRNGLNLAFGLGGLIFFIVFLRGALSYITAGGDKDAIEKSKKQLTTAFIGVAILFSTYAILFVVESLFGISILGFEIPTL